MLSREAIILITFFGIVGYVSAQLGYGSIGVGLGASTGYYIFTHLEARNILKSKEQVEYEKKQSVLSGVSDNVYDSDVQKKDLRDL